MINRTNIQAIILKSLKNVNSELKLDQQFDVDVNTCLFGNGAVLDSLSLVSVIVDTETYISEASGQNISLADDRALSQSISPFTNVDTLTNYILHLLSESE